MLVFSIDIDTIKKTRCRFFSSYIRADKKMVVAKKSREE
jgi:hypothetical protein